MASRTYKRTCLVLKKTKLGETDAIVTMLGSDGYQVRAVAKGLRKPGNRIGARLEPFSISEVLLHKGRSLDVVGEVSVVQTNACLRTDLVLTSAASVIAEFLEKVTRDGAYAGERVFQLSEVALSALGGGGVEQAGLFVAAFLMKALALQGFRPAIHECAACGRPLKTPARFDIDLGGALCQDCAPVAAGKAVDLSLVGWIDALLHRTFAELSSVTGAPDIGLLSVCESWMRAHLSLNLRSLGFFMSCI
ncbi:MAG: DNA repair protein RecO [Coriobacteriales bacterium]|jgi:DNA repair protein RecO (recombination protein O)